MTFRIVFWLIWVLSALFLIITLNEYRTFNLILFLILLALTGITMYTQERNRRSFKKILNIVENIDLEPIEIGIKKIETSQKECYLRLFNLESKLEELDQLKKEREKKYRDVVRKVLDLENKFNKKYKMLGEAVIKLKKDMKKD